MAEVAAGPAPDVEPLLPDVEGEVIGVPGTPVPGLDATHVLTEPGWLGPGDDVVFAGVIRWNVSGRLGCGILRRAPDGTIHPVLMEQQPLPGTGGRVKHPSLPLETLGDTLVIPAVVEAGEISQGVFAVPKSGGEPVLLVGVGEGEDLGPNGFVRALALADGSVLTEFRQPSGISVLLVPPEGDPVVLCDRCEPGFTTDGASVVVVRHGAALRVDLGGDATRLLGPGDAAPGANGLVTFVLEAWVDPDGRFLVHARTNDPARPDVFVRLGDEVEVLAACGAPAPGTAGTFEELFPARGPGADAVFGATIAGDTARPAGVYCARPGEAPQLLAASGDRARDLDVPLAISGPDVVASEGARVAFGAALFGSDVDGVFAHDSSSIERVVTRDARLAARPEAEVVGFPHAIRDAVHAKADGRTLVHVAIRERPDAILGALLLTR